MNLHIRLIIITFLVSCSFIPIASAAIDNDAPVISLRDPANGGCMESGSMLDNCYTSISEMNAWIWGIRKPAKTTPLVVNIGPGTFGQLVCGDAYSNIKGHISFVGAGMDKTTLASLTLVTQCANVSFADMTIGGTGIGYAVVVVNPGTHTTWTNVKLTGPELWQEYCAGEPVSRAGTHYWFGSKLVSTTGGSYKIACDESWFFGSEITTKADLSYSAAIPFKVSGSELHVYGSVIRALGLGTSADYPITAISATGGEVHIHGSGIDAIAVNAAPAAVTALESSNNAKMHVVASAYNLETGSGGTKTRISNQGGHVHAPYMWAQHPTPPDIISVTGADTAVVTDGAQPHLVIYSDACTSKWFDISTNACR